MTKFSEPIYTKETRGKFDALTFGKAPELRLADLANGIARFGGHWRPPNYIYAYLRAARILVNDGVATNTLDEIGLPAFYMQRHALELIIKRLLSWIYEYADGIGQVSQLSEKQIKRFKRSHNNCALCRDLVAACELFEFTEPPTPLVELTNQFAAYEKQETWARYPKSETHDGAVLNHVANEVAIPIVAMQEQLEAVTTSILYNHGEPFYEEELYDAWFRATGQGE